MPRSRAQRKRRIWPLMLTENEIADACFCSGRHVRRAVESGELVGWREHRGARVKYFTTEVIEWIRSTWEKRNV